KEKATEFYKKALYRFIAR
ncbi:hypothetical protein SOJ19_00120, partial [Treponema pallidum]